ncbi:MAG: signal peptidase II [Armatimonadota bacterium]
MRMWFFVTVAIVILLDQLSKWWVQWMLAPGQSIPIVPGILHLTLAFNAGIAFGLFPALGGVFLWVSLAIVAVVLIYYLRLQSPSAWTTAIASLLVGGALGNVWDRLRLGQVVDFIDFRVFPVFNLADTAITCATLLWVVHLWVPQRAQEQVEVQDG